MSFFSVSNLEMSLSGVQGDVSILGLGPFLLEGFWCRELLTLKVQIQNNCTQISSLMPFTTNRSAPLNKMATINQDWGERPRDS